jgi:hypothetical protein
MGSLHKWFKSSKSVDDTPGWVKVISGEPCAREEGEEKTPKCVSSDKRASMTKKERISAQRRKSAADPNQPEKSGAAKPSYVSTDKPEKKMNEEKDKPGKGSGKKDACYTKVKSRYDVWPSAYASGALTKCRKVGAANWGNKTEEIEMVRYCPKCQKDETRKECRYGEKYWDMFSIPSALTSNQLKYNIAQVHPANEEKQPDHEHSMARSELSTIVSAAKRLRKKLKGEGNIEAWVQSKITKAADYIDAAADYLNSGEHNVQGSMDEEISPQIPGGKSKYNFPVLPKENPDNVPITPLKRKGPILPLASKGKGGAPGDPYDDPMKKGPFVPAPPRPNKLQNAHYNMKTFGEFMQEALDKSKMKCNTPKSDPVGDSLTGKSHVVKACEGGKEKIIRFGQRGVKGSPKKKGESKEYASRRHRFQTRHAKNIAKGKMSAAFWANKTKW